MRSSVVSILALAAALMAVSCQKDDIPEEINTGKYEFHPATISAVAEAIGATRTEVAFAYDLLWEDGDEICVVENSNETNHGTFGLASGAGTKVGTFAQQGEQTFEGQVSAYYPASLVDPVLHGYFSVWPSVQTVDQKVPLYSTGTISGSEGDKFVFSSLGAVLQIVFNTPVENVTLKSIEVRDGSQRLCGRFSTTEGKAIIRDDNSGSNNGVRLNLGSGTVLGQGPNSFNICIPAGNYKDLTLIFTATDGSKCIMTGGKVNLARGELGKLTLSGSKFIKYALPGEFSVGNGKKVRFSMGNLYWNGSAFKMEANQYDYPTSWNSNHVGHFYWHSDAAKARAKEDDMEGLGSVLFTNATAETANPEFIVSSQKGLFRVLSDSEWQYLLENRADASQKYKYGVTVCGKANCLVIAPDNWTGGTIADSYTADEWKAASEEKGLVCLPPAGRHINYTFNDCGEWGHYLSDRQTGGMVNLIQFGKHDGSYVLWHSSNDRTSGGFEAFSIRLVTDVVNNQ